MTILLSQKQNPTSSPSYLQGGGTQFIQGLFSHLLLYMVLYYIYVYAYIYAKMDLREKANVHCIEPRRTLVNKYTVGIK